MKIILLNVIYVKEMIETEKENEMYIEDKRIWWENTKYLVKTFTIKYCKLIEKSKRNKERELREKLKK